MSNLSLEEINKLKTLFIHLPGTKATSIQVWFRAGSALEKSDNQGIAHFLEHMFFKGTVKRPNNGLAKEVDSFGGEFNAFTSFDYTCYYINAPKENLVQSVDILVDMVSSPQFLEQDLPAEREVVLEEYKRSQDSPQQYNFQLIQQHTFPIGYKHPILGTQESISRFSLKQLREFRDQFYSLANAMIIVAGDLGDESIKREIISIIQKHHIPSGKASIFPPFNLQHDQEFPIWCHHKKVKQATMTIAFQAPDINESHAVQEDLALSCLGHGETSLLHQDLVKKSSLCSGTSASTMYFNQGGMHVIKLVLPEQNIGKTLKELNRIIEKTTTFNFSHHELNKIKNQYIASKVYEFESVESLAFSYGHSFAQTGDIESEKKFIEKIKNCELDIVNAGLPNLFSKECYIHLQVPESATLKPMIDECKKFQLALSKQFKSEKKFPKSHSVNITKWRDPLLKVQEIIPGVTFIYRQNTQSPTFAMQVYLKGGLGDENKKTSGSHFLLSRCLTAGYGHKSTLSLKKDLDFKSASLHGFSGKNAYGLMMHGLTEHFIELSHHFFGCLLNPTFDPKIFKVEKELTLRMIKNQQEDPTKRLFSLFNQTYFGNFAYANDVYGTKSTIQSLNPEKITKLHHKHISQDEMVIAFSGDLDFSIVAHQVEESLTHLSKRKKRIFPIFKPKITKNKKLFVQMDREQTHLFYALKSTGLNTEEETYLKILTAFLSGQSSELFLEMRDRKGLCYAVSPVHHNALQAGYWGIYMASSTDKLPFAIAAIEDLLNRIGAHGLSAEELEKTKSMIAGQKVLNLQTNEDFATYYAIPALHGLGVEFELLKEDNIRDCNLKNLNKFLSSFVQREKTLVYVGRKALEN